MLLLLRNNLDTTAGLSSSSGQGLLFLTHLLQEGYVAPTGRLKRWNGSSWELKTLKYWNGSSHVEKPLKYWNGSTWIQ